MQQELSHDRPPQAGGDRRGADAAVRGISLLLLHYQRPQDDARGGRVLSQRSLRPGKLDRPAQERRSRADGARGRPGKQLGVHGDGVVGVEPESLERFAGAHNASARGKTPGGETSVVADGVRDLLRGFHPNAVSDRAGWTAIDLPVAVVEPLARGLPPAGGEAAWLPALLRRSDLEVGVRMPRSAWTAEKRKRRDA